MGDNKRPGKDDEWSYIPGRMMAVAKKSDGPRRGDMKIGNTRGFKANSECGKTEMSDIPKDIDFIEYERRFKPMGPIDFNVC